MMPMRASTSLSSASSLMFVGDECQLRQVAVVDHLIVLPSQLYALLLCFQLYKGLLIIGVSLLYLVVQLFGCNYVRLLCLTGTNMGLLHLLVLLEQRTDRVLDTNSYIPEVEVFVNGRYIVGKRTVEIVGAATNATLGRISLLAKRSC